MKLWNFLNGKKTSIGMGLFLCSMILKDVIIGFYGVHADWTEPTMKTFEYMASLFGVVGLTHKMVK